MKRWLMRILVCLFLGAVTTVAVAWGCAAQARGQGVVRWTHQSELSPEEIELFRSRVPPSETARIMGEYGRFVLRIGADWSFFERWELLIGAQTYPDRVLVIGSFGLPCRALEYTRVAPWIDADIDHANLDWLFADLHNDEEGRTFHSGAGMVGRPLPDEVRLGGFLVDTLFYGAIWGGVWFGFASAKPAIRRKRGRCPRCGYDLRGHRHEGAPGEPRRHEGLEAGCPECGWGRAADESVMK